MSSLSIQSFFARDASTCPPGPSGGHSQRHTVSHLNDSCGILKAPLTQPWSPKGTYQEISISQLKPGTGRFKFIGRIVNLFPPASDKTGRTPVGIPGHHMLVVKDDTGLVAVRLLATGIDNEFIHFGRLVTIWTSYVAEYSTSAALPLPMVSLIVTVHPAQNSTSCIKYHFEAAGSPLVHLCRKPIEYILSSQSAPLSGLMTLKDYLAPKREGLTSEARIVVCVRSIGPRKAVHTKDQRDRDLVKVTVFDETVPTCNLNLWEDQTVALRAWVPDDTVLLLTNPKVKTRGSATAELGIGVKSWVEVNPEFPDAEWLRRMASDRKKREAGFLPFPTLVWGSASVVDSSRTLFTIADLDQHVRDISPCASFTGKLNVLILGASLVECSLRSMLCGAECCCGNLIHANQAYGSCENCGEQQRLILNPKILGALADETGSMAPEKLIWSDWAWGQLLLGAPRQSQGYSPQSNGPMASCQSKPGPKEWAAITGLDCDSLRAMEEELLHARVTLTFGWTPRAARLCILEVEW
ncbi:hypothetical protein GQ53DRAFT_821914 [Thozetella sp. PMI_491]|nr:hypothetical protein GQ53DRAFT_821914 [Thozetella sp. PMI_491]